MSGRLSRLSVPPYRDYRYRLIAIIGTALSRLSVPPYCDYRYRFPQIVCEQVAILAGGEERHARLHLAKSDDGSRVVLHLLVHSLHPPSRRNASHVARDVTARKNDTTHGHGVPSAYKVVQSVAGCACQTIQAQRRRSAGGSTESAYTLRPLHCGLHCGLHCAALRCAADCNAVGDRSGEHI